MTKFRPQKIVVWPYFARSPLRCLLAMFGQFSNLQAQSLLLTFDNPFSQIKIIASQKRNRKNVCWCQKHFVPRAEEEEDQRVIVVVPAVLPPADGRRDRVDRAVLTKKQGSKRKQKSQTARRSAKRAVEQVGGAGEIKSSPGQRGPSGSALPGGSVAAPPAGAARAPAAPAPRVGPGHQSASQHM